MIFIQLSQIWHVNPLNTVPLIIWYRDAAFRFVTYRTDEQKKFWFAQESWAAAVIRRCFTRNRDTNGRGRPWCLGRSGAFPSAVNGGCDVSCPSSEFLRQRAGKLREALAHLVDSYAACRWCSKRRLGDSLAFDPFSLQQDCLAASEVDVGRC